ncbi:unnamed protein product (mitochondrion) [Plasmodiophora brassicae]|uniref:MORN repeat-containing protein 5 n=1 Tax=Plasmodiophora brassicae TaxID=37360 RepID=A0A3P3YFB4_PLABS|nr:unnamed protein product [Plasmodiophora brassicae]
MPWWPIDGVLGYASALSAHSLVFTMIVALITVVIVRRVLRLVGSGRRPRPVYRGEQNDKGQFRNGKFHGEGMYRFNDGKSFYRGSFAHSMFEGQGEEVYGDSGAVYVGQFKGSKRHGRGDMTYTSGASYSGKWANGLKHGNGTYWYAGNGGKFIGHFEDGARNGPGEYICKAFRVVGKWTNNELDADAIVYAKKGFSLDSLQEFVGPGKPLPSDIRHPSSK